MFLTSDKADLSLLMAYSQISNISLSGFFLKNPKEGKKDYLIGKKYSRGYGSPAKTIMNTHRQVSNILFSYSYSMKFSKDPTK